MLLKVSRIDFIDSSNNFQMCDAITSQQIQSPGWSNLYTFLTLLWFSVNLMTHNGSSSWDCSHSWITQLLTTPRFAVYNLLQELGRDFLFQRLPSFSLFCRKSNNWLCLFIIRYSKNYIFSMPTQFSVHLLYMQDNCCNAFMDLWIYYSLNK